MRNGYDIYDIENARAELSRRGWLPEQHGAARRAEVQVTRDIVYYTTSSSSTNTTLSTTGERTFGVEIECILPVGTLSESFVTEMKTFGINIETGYRSTRSNEWKVTTDSSITAGSTTRSTAEIVSPVLSGGIGRDEIRKVLAAMNELGCDVNKSTGMHVHIGIGDLDFDAVKRLIRGYTASQTTIDTMLAKSRRSNMGNTYCKPWSTDELESLGRDYYTNLSQFASAHEGGDIRYRTVNVLSYTKYGTIEFRQHHGTTEPAKVLAWISFTMRMVEAAKQGVIYSSSTLESLFSNIQLDQRTRNYLFGRRDVLEGVLAS
jgi:hypothetical protein